MAIAYTDTVLMTIELAKRFNVNDLNMHLSEGVYFTLPEKRVYLYDERMDDYIGRLTDFREKCEEAIGESEKRICIENTEGYNRAFMQKGLELLLQSNVFALTFDIGHNAEIGGGDEAVIMKHIDKLCHMHLHDAKRKRSHLPLGTGELDIPKYLRLAKENNCRAVLETKPFQA